MEYHIFSFLSIFILSNLQFTKSAPCALNFSLFPYEARSDCFNIPTGSTPLETMHSCCHSSLQNIFEAMAVRTNATRTVFLDPTEALECTSTFQGLHVQTNLSQCQFQDFISSSSDSTCSKDVRSILESLGVERFDALRSSCKDLTVDSYSDNACFSCVTEYRRSLEALEEGNGGEVGTWSQNVCPEALLVSLASSDVGSVNWVRALFSCLWDEIYFPFPLTMEEHEKGRGFPFGSKKLMISIAIAAVLAVLAPILYKLTRNRLKKVSQKEIEDLSVIVMKKSLEDDYANIPFSFSGLYIFSQVEIARATDNYNISNFIGEGSIGKVYLGIMPSGMKVAVKRYNEEMKVESFATEVSKVAKVRHPNVASILGYCDKEEQCLVCEYCANGNLESWLLGDWKSDVLTWDQRLRIAYGIVQGLLFLRNNPYEKIIHSDIKLTNILLNEKFEPKISDFVLSNSKWTAMDRKSDGHSGYELAVQPNDIVGFGVVLLQLLTGRKVVDFIDSRPRSLVNEARTMVMKGGNTSSIADPRLNGLCHPIAFQRLLLMAVFITASSDRDRPTLDEILHKIQEAHSLT
ncbi:probable receptor-like protein kinase At1g80640 isoform X1 [Magnolia sinica]|uniref:probable receptor-like protein kinase At1g80640 isoform X1 n=1 Tax=Magnolia sinica TaxID=86752 RepID=UPI0026599275|nr:probable receptor-like protein kinase At1g80640 isoform X1 [Magnolia sinica]XP_058114320.1 probable receptor-like protein kinase At1g80640 isoform X1 [Magnolia sinica]